MIFICYNVHINTILMQQTASRTDDFRSRYAWIAGRWIKMAGYMHMYSFGVLYMGACGVRGCLFSHFGGYNLNAVHPAV